MHVTTEQLLSVIGRLHVENMALSQQNTRLVASLAESRKQLVEMARRHGEEIQPVETDASNNGGE